MVVAGGCTQATYANCFNALKYEWASSGKYGDAPTCSDKNIKWSEVEWTDFANAQKDIATIRANPAIARFIDCVCKSVCGEFQDFKDAAITQSGACAEAAKKVASSLLAPSPTEVEEIYTDEADTDGAPTATVSIAACAVVLAAFFM